MEKQMLIIVRGGIIQHIHTNFDVKIRLIDHDCDLDEIYQPDLIENKEIL